MNRNLHDHMADMAEEVTVVDLRDRVRASSRRATVRRRALLASSAAVAVVAVAGGVVWAGSPRPSGDEVAPVTSSSPSPSPSKPTAVTSRGAVTADPVTVPARLFYLADGKDLRRLDGSTGVELFVARTPACGLVVSPDRTRIAYVVADGGGATGDLIVARPDGTDKKTVVRGAACTGGNSPVWQPGSRKILLRIGNQAPRVLADVTTGKVSDSPLSDVDGYLAWSPHGAHVAYAEADKIVVARPDGDVVHRVAHADETPTGGFSVQGVSDDGRRVVVGMLNTDPDIIRTGSRLVDVTTGKNVDLPSAAGRKPAIYPAAGNNVLVRGENGGGHQLSMLSPAGKVLDTRTEPAGFRTATLLTSY